MYNLLYNLTEKQLLKVNPIIINYLIHCENIIKKIR
jgi:hypothetical protein